MSRARKVVLGVVALLVLVALIGAWRWYLPTRYAVGIGAAMLAKQICSCVYIANRELADCRADQFESMDPINVELLPEEQRVRAWLSGFAERTATHREGLGCTLE